MSDDVPPPRWTPSPPLPLEAKTNPGGLATNAYVKQKLKAKGRVDNIKTGGVGLGVLLAAVTFLDKRVAAQTDSGMKGVVEVQKGQDARVTTLEKRSDRTDALLDVQNQKIDLLLNAARVPLRLRPDPVPPLEPDGGK